MLSHEGPSEQLSRAVAARTSETTVRQSADSLCVYETIKSMKLYRLIQNTIVSPFYFLYLGSLLTVHAELQQSRNAHLHVALIATMNLLPLTFNYPGKDSSSPLPLFVHHAICVVANPILSYSEKDQSCWFSQLYVPSEFFIQISAC
jgi:hypothetical protein